MLQNAIGIEPPKAEDSAEIEDLKETKKRLLAENAALKTKISDLETKAALVREAMGL